ncbi:MAG: alginate export family protein [Acidobacteria bacterium]|uniref:Alginate export family protein n=1 Tax=Candidatus Polarisedimenticola svalbardensis TaxID=2886004 RepID=A0A8J6Y2W9_9BACT|nr:alginate export family protein [Candidatus Polarisedimenticola svalbardensis]
MSRTSKSILTAAAILLLVVPVAVAGDELTEALKDGKVNADLRLRYETVEQDNIEEDAEALTFRVRLGYTTGKWFNLSSKVEFAANTAVGIDDYNSSANGMGQYPLIADPQDTQMVQAYLAYNLAGHTTVKAGRQRIILDNARFIGNVGWRQLEQTFDGVSAVTTPIDNFTGVFAHLTNTNQVQGEHNPLRSTDLNADVEVLNASWKFGVGTVTGYGYFADMEDAPALSNQTLGVRFTGKRALNNNMALLYTAEFAQQSDYSDGMSVIDAEYIHGILGLGMKKVSVQVGYELLGSNEGMFGFFTPLATLHAHNGWADMFLGTPSEGLEDTYLNVTGEVAGLKLVGVYHDFSSDFGGMDYGSEIDLMVAKKFGKHYSGMIKFADYSSDGYSVDTTKIWVMAGASF